MMNEVLSIYEKYLADLLALKSKQVHRGRNTAGANAYHTFERGCGMKYLIMETDETNNDVTLKLYDFKDDKALQQFMEEWRTRTCLSLSGLGGGSTEADTYRILG